MTKIGQRDNISAVVDKGSEYPKRGSKAFMSKPADKRNEMLKPTLRRNLLIRLTCPRLSRRRIKAPGTIVKQGKARSCLNNGISRDTATPVASIIPSRTMSHILPCRFLL